MGSHINKHKTLKALKETIPPDSTCVVIFADRGERYLNTIYSDEWVNEHFGDVSYLWERMTEDKKWLATTY